MQSKPRREDDNDRWDATFDEMVRDGTLNEKIDPKRGQVFSLSGKGLLDAQRIIRKASGQPDACVCEYMLFPAAPDWMVFIHKPNEHCDWHLEAVKRAAAKTASKDDAAHARLFLIAMDETKCSVCGAKAVRTMPGGSEVCDAHDTRTMFPGAPR